MGKFTILIIIFCSILVVACNKKNYFEITGYPVAENEDGHVTPLNRTTYRVYPNENRSVYWMPDLNFPISELKECVIKDECNWNCSFPDDSGIVAFRDCIQLDTQSNTLIDSTFKYVSEKEWERYRND